MMTDVRSHAGEILKDCRTRGYKNKDVQALISSLTSLFESLARNQSFSGPLDFAQSGSRDDLLDCE